MNRDPLKPSMALLCKLASVVGHADEYLSRKAGFLVESMDTALDEEVRQWLKDMGPLAPMKRADEAKLP